MKDIKDYLHLYLGCEVETRRGRGLLVSASFIYSEGFDIEIDDTVYTWTTGNARYIKPILRPLSDITDAERLERGKAIVTYGKEFIDAEYHRWLLSKGFDLFGLIEAGLAIDKTTIDDEKKIS